MSEQLVVVFGGTGFVGKHIVSALAKRGYRIRVVSRYAGHNQQIKTAGNVGQITFQKANIRDGDSVKAAVENADIVINLVGVAHESGKQCFTEMHAKGAERVAQAAAKSGASQFIQMSSLGVDKAKDSVYARTKMHGEAAVKSAFPNATIIRPSVIFGLNDSFYNRFGGMTKSLHFLPLIGGGKTRFQPVYANDVANAICEIINKRSHQGLTFELGGPDTLSLKDIFEQIRTHTERKTVLFPIPFALANIIATFLQLLPNPLLTRDQVRLLKNDNIVSQSLPGFDALRITPTPTTEIIPHYLPRYKKYS